MNTVMMGGLGGDISPVPSEGEDCKGIFDPG